MDQRHKCRSGNYTSLRTHRCKFSWPGSGNIFLHITPKAQANKGKIDNLNFIKMRNVYASKDSIKSKIWDSPSQFRTTGHPIHSSAFSCRFVSFGFQFFHFLFPESLLQLQEERDYIILYWAWAKWSVLPGES